MTELIEDRAVILETHLPLIRKIARRYAASLPPGMELCDLEQDMAIAAMQAIELYCSKPRKTTITKFLVRRVKHAAIHAHWQNKGGERYLVVQGTLAREAKHWSKRVDWEKLHNNKGEPLV